MPGLEGIQLTCADSRRGHLRAIAGLLIMTLLCAACGAPPTVTDPPELQTAIAETVEALTWNAIDTAAAPTATPSATASATPTLTLTPTITTTPTPTVITASVSMTSNCRSAPSAGSSPLGAIEAGETVELVGRTTFPNYWYVSNPDRPGEYCWLWGEQVTVVGDTDPLPVLTPAFTPVPPAPLVSVAADFEGFQICGGLHAIFKVRNTGRTTFATAQRYIKDLDSGSTVFNAELDRHPFAPSAPECPPGHSNILEPGATAYIYIPVDDVPYGDLARASLKICTEDYLGGHCLTVAVDFRFPDE